MERFIGSSKSEWILKLSYKNEADASADILSYLINYYSIVRTHNPND